jgi:hypothetical protein
MMKKVSIGTRPEQQPHLLFIEREECKVWTDWSDRIAHGTEIDMESGVGWEAQPDPKNFKPYDCTGCSFYFLCQRLNEIEGDE